MKNIVLPLTRPSASINTTKLARLIRASFSVVLLVLFIVPVASAESATQTRDPYEHFFQQSFNNFQEEAETAREEGKLGLFVMFNDPDCPWCQKMKATIMNQVGVQEFYRKHFRIIHLDTTGDTMMSNFDGTELAEKDYAFKIQRVRATPVFMFFDLEGKKMMRYTGATRSAEEFLLLGEFVTSGAYKSTKFTRFKREQLAKLNKNK